MGLLIFVWGIYTELQNCMYQTAHASAFPNHCLMSVIYILKLSYFWHLLWNQKAKYD